MKAILLLLLAVCMMSACVKDDKDYDRCAQASLTITCIKTAAGVAPHTTTYNDMDEVVDVCRYWAQSVAHKPIKQIPEECK